jgi:hypothetical protein
MNMKKTLGRIGAGLLLMVTIAGVGATLNGCAYGGVAATPDGTVVIVRNDGFLFGLLRKVYVCKNTAGGLMCTETNAP